MFSWQTYAYRDVIEVVEKYSDRQRRYFSTNPGDRLELILEFINEDEDGHGSKLLEIVA